MNIELILFGVGVLAMLVSWRWMIKPTLLDTTRDKLFDLREEVRAFFLVRPRGLEDPIYANTRGLINGHLRNTEELTFFRFVAALVWLERNKDAAKEISEKVNRRFKSDDQDVARYVYEVRRRAIFIMLGYAGTTSVLALALIAVGYIIQPFLWVAKAINSIFTGRAAHAVFAAQAAAVVIAVTACVGLGGRAAAQAAMEDCALYQSA